MWPNRPRGHFETEHPLCVLQEEPYASEYDTKTEADDKQAWTTTCKRTYQAALEFCAADRRWRDDGVT